MQSHSPGTLEIRTIGIALAAFKPAIPELAAQLRSIQDQSWREWICVLSFDSEISAVSREPALAPFRADPRFIWSERGGSPGLLANFAAAIQAVVARGVDAIACCDQDDVWYPEKLALSREALLELGPRGLIFCDMHVMDAQGHIAKETAWGAEKRGVENCAPFDLLVRNVVPGTGMLFDARLAREFPDIPRAAVYHDHWYPLVAAMTGRLRAIHKPLYAYRIHDKNVAGLSRYTGFFARKAGDDRLGTLAKCRAAWHRSEAFAQAAEAAGLPLGLTEKRAFRLPWDLGLGLALHGLRRLKSDPALARACFARAIGKALSIGRAESPTR